MAKERDFIITFEGKGIERNVIVRVKNADADIGVAAQYALNSFISSFGSLKKNKIIKMQEIDPETKENIGEPILPEENTYIPIGR